MFLSASTLKLLMDKGLAGDDLVEVYRALEADYRSTQPVASPSTDSYAERKKAADRERQRRLRGEAKAEKDRAMSRDIDGDPPATLGDSPATALAPTHVVVSSLPSLRSEEITPRLPSVATPPFGKPNGFARFWEAFPNKVGKRAAEAEYDRALKRIPGPDPPGVILAGVERAKLSRQWIEGYIPHPKTWLRQDRWADEPAETTPNPRRGHDQPPNGRADRRRAWAEIAAEAGGPGPRRLTGSG